MGAAQRPAADTRAQAASGGTFDRLAEVPLQVDEAAEIEQATIEHRIDQVLHVALPRATDPKTRTLYAP